MQDANGDDSASGRVTSGRVSPSIPATPAGNAADAVTPAAQEQRGRGRPVSGRSPA